MFNFGPVATSTELPFYSEPPVHSNVSEGAVGSAWGNTRAVAGAHGGGGHLSGLSLVSPEAAVVRSGGIDSMGVNLQSAVPVPVPGGGGRQRYGMAQVGEPSQGAGSLTPLAVKAEGGSSEYSRGLTCQEGGQEGESSTRKRKPRVSRAPAESDPEYPKYLERRKKNNESARVSRSGRKQREENQRRQMQEQIASLTEENNALKADSRVAAQIEQIKNTQQQHTTQLAYILEELRQLKEQRTIGRLF